MAHFHRNVKHEFSDWTDRAASWVSTRPKVVLYIGFFLVLNWALDLLSALG